MTLAVLDARSGPVSILQLGENTAEAARQAAIATASADAAAASSHFYATRAEGVAAVAVGGYFTSPETGELRMYKRTGTAPFYVDQGDAAAPIGRGSVSVDDALAANSDNLLPTQKAVKTYADAKSAALAGVSGSALVGFLQSGTGTTARTAQAKMRDIVAAPDFTSHAVADAAGVELYNPVNVTSTRANGAAVVANQWGPGRVTTADGNKRGKWFANVTAAPASVGNHDSIETAFNGDLSHSIFQIEHRITGSTTLTQPTTGYVYTPEAYPFYGVLYNTSGYNHSTTTNDGRTGAAFSRVSVKHYGQGDAVAYNGSVLIAAQKVGATHFLAQPAGVLFNGDMTCSVNYVYMNPRELSLGDGGFDVACIGDVVNMIRTNETGGQSCWWGGYRVQSTGTKAINNVLSLTGKANVGIDFSLSSVNFGTNKAAISLKANDRIYLNNYSTNGNFTDGFNGDYLEYSSGLSGFNFVVSGNSLLQVTNSQVTVNGVKALFNNKVGMSALGDYANDAAASAGGVAIGECYRNGSVVQVRVT